jgi:tetratricopeptide (TPR) repeat protein
MSMLREQPPAQERDLEESASSERLRRSALEHYRRGNYWFDLKAWDQALEEWRRSTALWNLAKRTGRAIARPFIHLRAVVLLLLTVLLVYNAIYTLFPRNPFELMMLSGGPADERSWWERWLDTGRPRGTEGERMELREWWERLRQRWSRGGGQQARRGSRPGLDERWEQLLRRYGRWGTAPVGELNYYVIAGYGLSRMGEYEAAVAAFEKGLEKTKEPSQLAELYQGLANTHYYQGYKLQPDGLATYNLALVRKATEAYERSTEYETRPLSFGNLGWMYFLLGDYKRAEMYSRRALNLDPSLDYVRLNLGLIYLFENRLQESFNAYRQVIRRNPPAETYLGGINDLREVLRDRPGQLPFADLALGMLALKSGAYGQAQEALGRFVTAPNVPERWRSLGARLLQTMDIGELER